MYERILVPTDGSDVALTAVDAAIVLAERFDAELHVLHVVEAEAALPEGADEATGELARLGREAAEAAVDEALERGVAAQSAVLEDDEVPHRAILAYAQEHDADLIAMGTHGRTGIGRWVLGSVAEQTVRESPIPVLTVHEESGLDADFDSVLVPTDGSDRAEAAATHAIRLASACDAALHVVHAVDVGMISEDTAGVALDALEEAGRAAIDRVVERGEAAGLSSIEASVLTGRAYRAITDYAEEADVDCIVMGTHGRTGMDRFLVGSVTERVLRLSDVPVIAVGDGEESA